MDLYYYKVHVSASFAGSPYYLHLFKLVPGSYWCKLEVAIVN